jgi:HD-GYP domain-containing protein (c-di-GMP phosphodiesterase class II)
VRLATIVDVYDALTTRRPYVRARTTFAALELMLGQMAGHFDRAQLKAFIRFLGPRTPGSRVGQEVGAGAAL